MDLVFIKGKSYSLAPGLTGKFLRKQTGKRSEENPFLHFFQILLNSTLRKVVTVKTEAKEFKTSIWEHWNMQHVTLLKIVYKIGAQTLIPLQSLQPFRFHK